MIWGCRYPASATPIHDQYQDLIMRLQVEVRDQNLRIMELSKKLDRIRAVLEEPENPRSWEKKT